MCFLIILMVREAPGQEMLILLTVFQEFSWSREASGKEMLIFECVFVELSGSRQAHESWAAETGSTGI